MLPSWLCPDTAPVSLVASWKLQTLHGPHEAGPAAWRWPALLLQRTGRQELAPAGGVPLDPGTRGPAVDTALETGTPLVFAAGNLIHPAEAADVAG